MLRLRHQLVWRLLQRLAEATLTPTLEVKDNDPAYGINKSRPLREAQRAAFVYISIYRIKRWSRFAPTKHDRFSIPGLRIGFLIPTRC